MLNPGFEIERKTRVEGPGNFLDQNGKPNLDSQVLKYRWRPTGIRKVLFPIAVVSLVFCELILWFLDFHLRSMGGNGLSFEVTFPFHLFTGVLSAYLACFFIGFSSVEWSGSELVVKHNPPLIKGFGARIKISDIESFSARAVVSPITLVGSVPIFGTGFCVAAKLKNGKRKAILSKLHSDDDAHILRQWLEEKLGRSL